MSLSRQNGALQLTRHVIEPNQAWLRVNVRELIERRDLLLLLFRRDLLSRYKQTILGPAWYILQPLSTALVFSLVFGNVVAIPTEGVPRLLFYLCGLLGWTLFSQTLHSTATTFISNAELFGKVHFPRLIVPLAGWMSHLVAFALQLVVFLMFYVIQKHLLGARGFGIGPQVFLLPLLVLHVSAIGLGTGLWFSALTARYRDLKHAMTFLVSMWMFLSPVIYPMTEVPARFKWVILVNPMAPVIEGFRWCLLGSSTVPPIAWAASIAITTVILVSGLLLFQRAERTVVDTI